MEKKEDINKGLFSVLGREATFHIHETFLEKSTAGNVQLHSPEAQGVRMSKEEAFHICTDASEEAVDRDIGVREWFNDADTGINQG